MCKCALTQLGFNNWQMIQTVANTGKRGFGGIPGKPGVYCLRAGEVGESDPDKIITKFHDSSIYSAFQRIAETSDSFFEECGFGSDWGWRYYRTGPEKELNKVRNLTFNADGTLACPILYIGCTGSLTRRLSDLMWWAHPFNHGLWALLYSGWRIEVAVRVEVDYARIETELKDTYKLEHGKLPPFMVK